ncbi:MAG: hypothetical protein IKJ65_10455, partial [Clostridia bacterium]|nr:hypothetical protein [Clostridia bacterium]
MNRKRFPSQNILSRPFSGRSSHQKSAFFDERGRSPEILLKFPGGDRKGEAFSVAALCENARFLST